MGLVLLAGLSVLLSCAHPLPPTGGPLDEIPPWLVAATPESASTGHGPIAELRFEFSEKMDRADAFRWLQIYPRRTLRSTRWQASRVAIVRLDEPLPADTVVIVEVLPGMKDNHGVTHASGRQWAFATGDSLPDGEITGRLVLDEKPLVGGVAELLPAEPESVRVAQRPLLRRAVTDSLGVFRLTWLPASGEPWLLRTFDDRNGDRRLGDNEAVRLWPDTLRLLPADPRLDLGVRTLFQPTTPGTLEGALAERPDIAGPVLAFLQKIAEADTGFVAAPQPRGTPAGQAVPDTGRFTLLKAGPGLVRAVFFVDVDGDSLLSVWQPPADTLWALEPWTVVDSLRVEPGLPAPLPAPVWPDTLTPWSAPPPPAAVVDTLRQAAADTLGLSTALAPGVTEVDTLLTPAPSDTLDGRDKEP